MPRLTSPEALARLGSRLRARRVFLQLPLAHCAREMGLSKNMLLHYETGQGNPPAMTLLRMAKTLGTTAGHLLGERQRESRIAAEEVDRAVRMMADPAIAEVATTMFRMDNPNRHAVVIGVREMAAHPLLSIKP